MKKRVNIGDRVRVTNVDRGTSRHGYSVGEVYEVIGLTEVCRYPEIITSVRKTWLTPSEFEVVTEAPSEKPPLGLKPRKIHAEERLTAVAAAVTRYIDVRKPIPNEWLSEYNELVAEVSVH